MDLLTAPPVPNAVSPTLAVAMTEKASPFAGLLAEAIATLDPGEGMPVESGFDLGETEIAEFQTPAEAGSLLSLMQPLSVAVPMPVASPGQAAAPKPEAGSAIPVLPSLGPGGERVAAPATTPTPDPVLADAQGSPDQHPAMQTMPTGAVGTTASEITDHPPQAAEAMTAASDARTMGDESKAASPPVSRESPAATATLPAAAPKSVVPTAPSAPTAAAVPPQPIAEDMRDLPPAATIQAKAAVAVAATASAPAPRRATTLTTPPASPAAETTPKDLTPLMPQARIEGLEQPQAASPQVEALLLPPDGRTSAGEAAASAVPIDPTNTRQGESQQLDPMPEAMNSTAPAAASSTQTAAPPMPPAPRPNSTVVWPARQIAPFAVALALGSDASLTVTLDPVELGRVEVSIERSGTEATIRIMAERPETLALLQRDSRELERALSDAGLAEGGTSMSFSLGGGDASQQEARQAAQRRNGFANASPLAASVPRLSPQHADHRRGLLDLAI